MELKNKIKRRSFFTKAGAGTAGFFFLNAFPFRLFQERDNKKAKAAVQLNPLAVSRKSTGKNNG